MTPILLLRYRYRYYDIVITIQNLIMDCQSHIIVPGEIIKSIKYDNEVTT